MTTTNQTNYLVYSADPWKPGGNFTMWGTPPSKALAEGLRYELIKGGADKPENIHIMPVEPDEISNEMRVAA